MQMWEIVICDCEKEGPMIVTDVSYNGGNSASAKLGSGNRVWNSPSKSLQECEVADEDVIPQV